MPLDDLAVQRRSIGAARLPDGCEVAHIPGVYGVLVIILTPEGPLLQGSALTPDDCDDAADAARDTAIAVRRGETDLIAYVRGCWERRRLRQAGLAANEILNNADEQNRG